ncbi:MAG TPA: dephospho-CoA kinase [Castellaniella sp.]|uniref:dephospho-CoA kinase n=1 Tax=Castellaniella sp. TaxID=1955812 RepID=UPI002EE541BD
MLTIGLTGGIGSGKSKVADFLAQWGASIVDADQIAHSLTAVDGEAITSLRQVFGDAAIQPDGGLDRRWMRDRVFHDASARLQLEAVLHPLIDQAMRMQARLADGPYCVFVVPLLVESGRWRERVARICVVDCDPQTQISRVQSRSGLTQDTIERIMTAQASREERLAAADDVILNDGTTDLDTLRARTRRFHDIWCSQAAR